MRHANREQNLSAKFQQFGDLLRLSSSFSLDNSGLLHDKCGLRVFLVLLNIFIKKSHNLVFVSQIINNIDYSLSFH